MTYPGLTLGVMIAVAIGTAIFYYFKNETPNSNYQHSDSAYTYIPQALSPSNTPPRIRKRRNSNGSEKTCTICLDVLQGNSTRSLPCAHVFHTTCISKWLALSNTCPVCRSGE